jgi:hypothetical protein
LPSFGSARSAKLSPAALPPPVLKLAELENPTLRALEPLVVSVVAVLKEGERVEEEELLVKRDGAEGMREDLSQSAGADQLSEGMGPWFFLRADLSMVNDVGR